MLTSITLFFHWYLLCFVDSEKKNNFPYNRNSDLIWKSYSWKKKESWKITNSYYETWNNRDSSIWFIFFFFFFSFSFFIPFLLYSISILNMARAVCFVTGPEITGTVTLSQVCFFESAIVLLSLFYRLLRMLPLSFLERSTVLPLYLLVSL